MIQATQEFKHLVNSFEHYLGTLYCRDKDIAINLGNKRLDIEESLERAILDLEIVFNRYLKSKGYKNES